MELEAYLGRVQAIVWRAAEHVSATGVSEAQRLLDHGEPAEGLRSLAWAIVNEGARVPWDLVKDIRSHASDLVDEKHLPPNLDAHTF